MKKKIDVRIILVLLLLFDLCFSFIQHYHKSLDGDLSSIVLGYPEVLKDPFGLGVLFEHKVYGGTNRFFVHWFMSGYFMQAPLLFQSWVSPIDSIYLSCAFAKTIIQLSIIVSLSLMISGARNILDKNFLLAAALITPFFQTNGYNGYMGIINSSITYTFFYALQIALLLIFFLPFHRRITTRSWTHFSYPAILILFILCLVLTLGGPLSPAILIIGCSLTLFNMWRINFSKNNSLPIFQNISSSIFNIPRQMLFFILIILMSLYSVYLGSFNAENFFHSLPLMERYKLLPLGIYYSFSQKLGPPILLLMILINYFLISKQPQNEKQKLNLVNVKWISAFIIIYLLILPLGGYREYRPNIVRADTLLPVTICLIYLYATTTLSLLNTFKKTHSNIYISASILFILIFVIADKSIIYENDCERMALQNISGSTEKIVHLNNQCNVMSWHRISNPEDSKLNCELLRRWNVVNEDKRYYQD